MPEKLDAGSRDGASRPDEVADAGRVDQSSANQANPVDAASPDPNSASDPMTKPSGSPSGGSSSTPTTTKNDPTPSAAGVGASAPPVAGTQASAGVGAPVAGASGASAGAGGGSGSLSETLIQVAWRAVANPQIEWVQRWRQAAGASGSGLSADLVQAVLSTFLVQCARDARQCIETCAVVESDCGQCAADMNCADTFANTCGLLGAKCAAAPGNPDMPTMPTPMMPGSMTP
jgi:hypothetical protein